MSNEQQLMRSLGFSASDLDYNRRGELSPSQKAHLERRNALTSKIMFGALALTLVGILFFVFISGAGTPMLVFATFTISMVGLMFANIWRQNQRTQADIQAGRVAQAAGTAQFRKRGSGEDATFYITVGSERFEIDELAYEVLVPGSKRKATSTAAYRVYYLPGTKKVVAIEPA